MRHRASIVIAAHKEGERLWRTVQACLDSGINDICDIVVADDASKDGSVEEMARRFPCVNVVAHTERHGVSPTKDLGARQACGDVLVFLDGHCKPNPGSIERIICDVEQFKGEAIIVPAVPALDCERWENNMSQVGNGYRMNLENLECKWINRGEMPSSGQFYESPALIGCCVAMSRRLYSKLEGFDPYMTEWGVEDLDFGLKAWLAGHQILHDPAAIIGHRFQRSFDNFSVSHAGIMANQMRMARKNFTDTTWLDWIKRCRSRQADEVWNRSWALFESGRTSLERERECLIAHRVRDEFMYASQFGLDWPVGSGKG